MKVSSLLIITAAILCGVFVSVSAQSTTGPTLKIGVFMSVSGSFAIGDANNGLKLWARYVNDRGGIKLRNGTLIPVSLTLRDDQSNVTLAAQYWREFADAGFKFVIGGHTSMTVAASTFFEPLQIVNIHCCTGPDSVYTTVPKQWILGIHRSSLDYP